MPRKNLINQKFNHWTVLSLDEEKTASSKRTYWICQCDCEEKTIRSVRSDGLTGGTSKSCGCENRKLARERLKENGAKYAKMRKENLIGQSFGYWTVIKDSDMINGHTAWTCRCKCGTIRSVLRQSLVSGASQSCGCLNMSHGEKAIHDLLKKNNITFVQEYNSTLLLNPKNSHYARFDFFVDNKYMIEFDGIQHFENSVDRNYFKHENLQKRQEYDKKKNDWCKDNNIPLIRIPYTHLKELCLEDLLLETTNWRVV